MKLSVIALVLTLVCFTVALAQDQPMPRMTTVEPGNGKAGDTLAVTGENLAKGSVAELFLTDGKNDIKVEMIDQEATSIKFKVPANAKPARYSLMILTSGKQPKLIEQPVKVTVE
jgi:hypothetical protein